jgi:ribosome-interacting GTPase 1
VPANLTPEFNKKYREYQDAKTPQQKSRLLRELIGLAPKHKGTENLLARLKKSLSKLESRQEAERRAKKARSHKGIRKVAPLVVLVGPPNSGKTTLFKEFTGEGKPAKHPFSTQQARTAIGRYGDARLQFIDCPSFDFSYANNADVVLLTAPDAAVETKFRNKTIVPAASTPEKTLRRVWKKLGLIRVYTETGDEPMLLKKGATIEDAARDIHKTFAEHFEWARVRRRGRTFRVGLDFKLREGDVVWMKSSL